MPFLKGQSGNPGGKTGQKIIADQLRKEAMRSARGKPNNLERMCAKVWREAVNGRPWAVQFITERLDGKVPQPVDGQVGIGPTETFIEILREISSGKHNGTPMTIEEVPAIEDPQHE